MKISGVYKITNKITGDFYIGSSKDIMKRWVSHKNISTWKHNPGMKIYRAFQQYGLENFDFEIIEETDSIHDKEQYFINILKPAYNDRSANGLDIERRKEYKRKYSQSEKGKEAQRKYGQSEKGKEKIGHYQKQYYKSEKGRESKRKSASKYMNSLCDYKGEILTLSALGQRLKKTGIEYPFIEARMYLIENN